MKTYCKYILIFFVAAECSFSQDAVTERKKDIHLTKEELRRPVITKNEFNAESNDITGGIRIIEEMNFRIFRSQKEEKYTFDLMSSVGSNISFGGFWDKYAVINFTPQINIKPVSFISIYANHYLNCFIPLNGVKEYSRSLILQGIAILAIDNSMKLFLNSSNSWISSIVSFAAKNILINILIKPSINNSSKSPSPVLKYENYYYSMSITF